MRRATIGPTELAARLRLHPPTAQQAAIVSAPLEPLLVVAGAGSGKTETMAARVVWLVANGLVRPEEVLGLTFTRKAAAELSARVRGRLLQLRGQPVRGVDGRIDGLAEEIEAGAVGEGDRAADSAADIGEPTISTYNAYAARVVAEHGLREGFEPSARLLPEARTWQLASTVVRLYDGDMTHVDWAPATVTGAVLDLAAQLAEHLRTPAELADWCAETSARLASYPPAGRQKLALRAAIADVVDVQRARAELVPLVEEYAERKRQAEAMDFGDQVARAAQVARAHPEVARAERARYRVVLLDEYQDTSHAQLVLLQSLFGGGHPVTAVGDPCQSIYAWRGASAANLARFPHHFPSASGRPARTVALTRSWRNGARILALANALSTPLRGSGAAADVPELEPREGADAGAVRCALVPTVDDEAEWVAERLAEVWAYPAARGNGEEHPTVAVLVRARAQTDRLAAALRARGLPVEVVGLGGLLATPEVRDVVATLRVLVDPTAGDALLRLLTGARWRLGPRDLDALGRRAADLAAAYARARRGGNTDGSAARPPEAAEERSIVEAVDDLGPAEAYSAAGFARLCRLRDELQALRGRTGQPIPDLVAEVEEALGVEVEVASRSGGDQALARGHLDAFGDVAAEFADAAEQPTLSAFLDYLRAADERERGLAAGQVEVQRGAVQVLTVHAAKGLEWDVVAVPGLTEGVFPVPAKLSDTWTKGLGVQPFPLRGDAADLPALELAGAEDQADVATALDRFADAWKDRGEADERRLAYVAVTRARHLLLCSGAWWDVTTRPRGPSVFLSEISAHCAAGGGRVDVWAPPPAEGSPNPMESRRREASWPFDPLGERRDTVEEAAALVFEMGDTWLTADEEDAGAAWADEAGLLLAERSRSERPDPLEVPLPSHLTVSQLVTLRRGPAELARAIRRPVPVPPAPLARRGTAFHAWLERRFGGDRLLDLDDLPGAADADAAPDEDLAALQEAFLASAWSDRAPLQVEVPFATVIGGVVVRGRMDAVFADGTGFDVVDWKTGANPAVTGLQGAAAPAVQLAAYRLAWADLAGVPVERVRAAFHYVRSNTTVRPADLLDAAGLAALVESVPAVATT